MVQNDNDENIKGKSWDRWNRREHFIFNPEQIKRMRRSRMWSGFFILLVGVLLLAYKMGAPIPGWLLTWPVLVMALGLLVAIKSGFRNPGGFIMILVGAVFFAGQSIPGIDLRNYIVPIVLMVIGVLIMLKPKGCNRHRRHFGRMMPNDFTSEGTSEDSPLNASSESTTTEGDNAEYINVNAVFGGVKKNIQSKNFKGGEITSFMGGAEINFMQADIQHPIELEVNNVFGGTKLIIPSNWDVRNEISALFGGVEDKRNFNTSPTGTDKRILLKGACVFGGVEVTNY